MLRLIAAFQRPPGWGIEKQEDLISNLPTLDFPKIGFRRFDWEIVLLPNRAVHRNENSKNIGRHQSDLFYGKRKEFRVFHPRNKGGKGKTLVQIYLNKDKLILFILPSPPPRISDQRKKYSKNCSAAWPTRSSSKKFRLCQICTFCLREQNILHFEYFFSTSL